MLCHRRFLFPDLGYNHNQWPAFRCDRVGDAGTGESHHESRTNEIVSFHELFWLVD